MAADERREGAQQEGDRPSDAERLVGETRASEPLTAAPGVQPPERESRAAPTPPSGVPTGQDADREAELGHS